MPEASRSQAVPPVSSESDARPAVAAPDGSAATGRSTEARLARLHLRTGAFGLARAELETLAGSGELDPGTLLDLAEIRWRTGDLPGAGAAAQACLAAGGDEALGFVIAAEAAVALGRPGEAKRLANHALERLDRPLEALFAGIDRSAVWPTDPAAPGEPAGALFATDAPRAPDAAARLARARPGGPATPGLPVVTSADAAAEPGFWDTEPAGPDDELRSAEPSADAGVELSAGREAAAAGDPDGAAVHLAIALRLDPALAPAVLDIAAGASGPVLEIVRGDALRLVGHELEARRAYASAARLLARRDTIRTTGTPDSEASSPSPSSPDRVASPASRRDTRRPTRPPAQPARPTTPRPARPAEPDLPPEETT